MEKLYPFVENNQFTDFQITFCDGTNNIIINVHKVVLAASSEYFHKMFSFGKESITNKSTINVSNSFVASDLVMSFYGKKLNSGNLPEWQHRLETVICSDLFMLTYDSYLLQGITIPAEEFDLFLQIIYSTGFSNDNIIRLINENISDEYDLNKLDKNLINEMIKLESKYFVASCLGQDINIFNIVNNKTKLKFLRWYTSNVAISPKNNLLMFNDSVRSIEIYDLQKNTTIITINTTHCAHALNFSPDSKYIIYSSGNNICIHETGAYKNIKNAYYHTDIVWHISFSPDNKYIGSCSRDKSIIVTDFCTMNVIMKFKGHNNSRYNVCFSSNSKYIIFPTANYLVKMCDIESGNEIKRFVGHSNLIESVSFSSDDKLIVSGGRDCQIKVWNVETTKTVAEFKDTSSVIDVYFFTNDQQIISKNNGGEIKIWNICTGNFVNTFKDKTPNACHFAVSHPSILLKRLTEFLSKN